MSDQTIKQKLWEDYATKYNKLSSAMTAAGIDHTLLRPLLDSYVALKNSKPITLPISEVLCGKNNFCTSKHGS